MAEQVYWEDVSKGMELPPLVKHPSTQQLVRYAGASGDYNRIHYDKDFALGARLDGVIIHGALKNAFLGQFMTEWMGPLGALKRLACQYRGMDFPGNTVTAKGRVLRTYKAEGENLVDCEIWLENDEGQRTTPGSATVVLPSR